MARKIDFRGSSRRHYSDAEFLLQDSRLPNAGHLFGFAAECGIKALLVAHGLRTDQATGDIEEQRPYKQYKTHVNVLINNMQTFPSSPNYSKYLGMMPNLQYFSDWDASHRYYDEAAIPSSHARWRQAALEIIRTLDQAKLDGVMP